MSRLAIEIFEKDPPPHGRKGCHLAGAVVARRSRKAATGCRAPRSSSSLECADLSALSRLSKFKLK